MRRHWLLSHVSVCAAVLACVMAGSTPRSNVVAAQSAPAAPSASQLDTLVAPIALYPDPLLASVLAASTYPVQIVEASRAIANGAKPTSAELSQWDTSVQALTAYPTVLNMMSNQLDWTTQLGQAVSQNQSAVMAAVQHVRAEASSAGNLQSTQQQTVTTQGSTIIIEPANPQVIYVPQYNPVAILAPAPAYVAAPAGYGLMTFGVGFAAGALTAYGCNWGSSNITVNNNYNYNHQVAYGNFTNTHNNFTNWNPPSNVGHVSGDQPLQTGRSGNDTGNYTTRPTDTGSAEHGFGSGTTADGFGQAHNSSLFGGAGDNGWATRAASDRGAESFGGGGIDHGFSGFGGRRR